jgi:hypothetical protein
MKKLLHAAIDCIMALRLIDVLRAKIIQTWPCVRVVFTLAIIQNITMKNIPRLGAHVIAVCLSIIKFIHSYI